MGRERQSVDRKEDVWYDLKNSLVPLTRVWCYKKKFLDTYSREIYDQVHLGPEPKVTHLLRRVEKQSLFQGRGTEPREEGVSEETLWTRWRRAEVR